MADQTNRFNLLIMNPNSLKIIMNAVANKINRKLEKQEGRQLITYLRENATKNWSTYSDEQLFEIIVNNYLYKFHTTNGRNAIKKQTTDIIDIHEIQKLNIGLTGQDVDQDKLDNVNEDGVPIIPGSTSTVPASQVQADEYDEPQTSLDEIKSITNVKTIDKLTNLEKILGFNDALNIQSIFNPVATYKKNYIEMDTRYRLADPDGTTKFAWDVLTNSASSGTGIINTLGQIKNIISMRIYPFRIPYCQAFDKTGQYRRVTMLIEEFSGMAIIGQEGRKFHFTFDMRIDGNMVDLLPLPDSRSCVFEFSKPITQLDKLTISFGNPLQQIQFDKDRDTAVIYYENPARFVANSPHNLSTGDLIYISGFTTTNTVADAAIILLVNRVDGWNIIVPSSDGVTFQIDDLDISGVVGQIVGQNVAVFYGSKRIFITMEFTYQNSLSNLI